MVYTCNTINTIGQLFYISNKFEHLKHPFFTVGGEFLVLVAQISKFKEGGGLGISLEGTVEKIDGAEQNPHHYIRYTKLEFRSPVSF